MQCRPVSPHQSGNGRTDHIGLYLPLKRAQNRIVQKGSALYNDVLTQLFGCIRANDLIQRIFHHADRKACGNVADGSAVFLRLLDRRIHEHSTTGTKVDRVLCEQSEFRKFLGSISERVRKSLNK